MIEACRSQGVVQLQDRLCASADCMNNTADVLPCLLQGCVGWATACCLLQVPGLNHWLTCAWAPSGITDQPCDPTFTLLLNNCQVSAVSALDAW